MSLKLLLVDDDPMVIFLHQKFVEISGLGTNPVCFADGQATLDYLNTQAFINNAFLILLDINMPGMNGWEFLDAIQSKPYVDNILVIMVTSSINTLDKEKSLQYKQVLDFIVKPLSIDSCKQIILMPAIASLINTV